MITRHTLIPMLLAASLALAAPALAQRAPAPPKPPKAADPDLSQLTADLSRLGDEIARISELAALSALKDLPDVHELAREQASWAREFGRQGRDHQHRSSGPEQTERVSKTFKVGRTGSLYLVNVSGDVVINSGSGDDIVVNAVKRVRQGSDAQQQLNAVSVDMSQQGSRVDVRTRYPEGGGNYRASVDYTVTVPAGTMLDLHSTSGDIRVTGVKGVLRADCTSGDIHVDGADSIEQVKTVSGDISVADSGGTDVRVSNYSGDLTLRNVKARSLDVTTISGEARLTEVTAERAAVKTLSGDVQYNGPFARGGHYEFSAHSGDVRLIPAANSAGFEIDARTFSGDVRCDLPLTLSRTEVPAAPATGWMQRHVRHEIKGVYGDGSALITVHTFNGDVIVGNNAPAGKR